MCPRFAPLALTLLALSSCAVETTRTARPSDLAHVTIIGLNDLHGSLDARPVRLGAGGAGPTVAVGGGEILAAYLDAARAANPRRTLVLDAGDDYQGTLLSNHFQGRSTLVLLNELGIDAATLGNHEFDYGPVQGAPRGSDPLGALRALVREARFPYLTANVAQAAAPAEPPFDGEGPRLARSKIFDLDGVRVGVVGAITSTTPDIQVPANVAGLAFRRLADAVPMEARRLRQAGASVVVLLAHAGGDCDMRLPAELGDVACQGVAPDEITAFLDAVPAGTVDVVLAGHLHAAQAHFIRGVPVLQTSGLGQSFSRVDLWVDPAAEIDAPTASRIPTVKIDRPTFLCHAVFANYPSCDTEEVARWDPASFGARQQPVYEGRPIAPKLSIGAALRPFRDEVRPIGEKPVANLPAALPFDRFAESPAANCVVDAAREAAERRIGRRIDAAVLHSGRIRFGIERGALDYGHLYDVLPFEERAALADLSGEELDRLGSELTVGPKRIIVVSDGWKTSYADPPSFPRHRGFLGRDDRALAPGRFYRVLVEEQTMQSIPRVFAAARDEKRVRALSVTIRDLVAERLRDADDGLPASCRAPVLGRSRPVEEPR